MNLQLVALQGPLSGRIFPLNQPTLTIGRSPDCTIVIASAQASRRHADITYSQGNWFLRDLGSANGTLVNQRRIDQVWLQVGDQIVIGDSLFMVQVAAAAPSPSVQPPQPIYTPAQPIAPLPPVQPAAAPVQPAASRRRLPTCLLISLFVGCIAVAGMAAGGTALYGWWRSTTATTTPPIATGPVLGGNSAGNTGGNSGSVPAATVQPQPTRTVTADAADWTILVYLDGDNNLESDALVDFSEMAEVGSNERVQIVVQFDRIRSAEGWDDDSNGNWSDVRRFLVQRGMRPTEDAALDQLGELNMGDSATLEDFIDWGISTYPARRYALILWDHGASWPGVASDDTSDGDSLSLPELASALENALQRTGAGKLDLIGFDACLMAQIDVLHAVAPYAQVAVASAELEPNSGWSWDSWLEQLNTDPTIGSGQLGSIIVETYMDSFSASSADEVTLSAFDLNQMDGIISELSRLSSILQRDLAANYVAIGQARSFTNIYAPSYPEEFNAVDLPHFLTLLQQQGATADAAAAAQSLLTRIETARLANGVGRYHRNSGGLSIYFPQQEELYVDVYERASPLPRSTGWADFLQSFYRGSSSLVQRPTIGELSLSSTTIQPGNPVSLFGSVSGSDIAYVFSFIGTANSRRDRVDLLDVDYVYPPGSTTSSDIPNWQDGAYDLQLNWDGGSWYLSNGASQIPILLGPVKYGINYYGVEGTYISAASGETIDAGLIFTLSGGEGTLARVWGFPRSIDKQEAQPLELQPQPGDRFTVSLRNYTDTGSALEPGEVEGQTIVFGNEPLRVLRGTTPAGDYVMGFLVRDIAGNYHYRYADVTLAGGGSLPGNTPIGGESGAGYQRYDGSQLGFAIDYPQEWLAEDTGRDKIVFYDPLQDDVFVVVDVYLLDAADAATVNRRMLELLTDAVRNVDGYQLRTGATADSLAGLPAERMEFVINGRSGYPLTVIAYAVTSPSSGYTYLVMLEAREQDFGTQLPTFTPMLESLIIR
jgi:hypothetical protein